jgi:outer membrane receptor protein involved in Fe transport
MLFHNTSDLSPTVQASSSYFSFSGYFICYISMLLPAGVRGEPNTTISLGIQNVLDEDAPFAAGAFENGYDESLATIKGRFWYVQVKKRF